MKPFSANGEFRPSTDGDGLRRRAVRGAGVTVFSGGLALGIQIIATLVLARMLSPGDFGLVTMVTTFSLLLANFGLNGFTEAVLQKEVIDHFLVSNLFWINAGLSLFLALGFAAAGTLLARFYGDPRVAHVAVVMSSTIFIAGTSVQHTALLKRNMRFSLASSNDVFARAVSVSVSILTAWAGWGYWALVAGAVAQSLSTSIGAWSLCQWIPSLPSRAAGTASMLRFAINAYGRFIANYSTWNLDNLLVGWRFGPAALGFYKKAYDLFALSTSQLTAPLTSVAVATLSRLNHDAAQYRRYLLGSISVMAFVGMGLGGGLTLVGKDLIRLLLGPPWAESGRIFMYFGPGIGMMLLYYTHGWIHLSIGRADRWLRWSLAEFCVTALLFLTGLPWGPVGIAVAWTVSFWILTFPSFWYAGKPINLGPAAMFLAVWRYVAASLAAGVVSAAIIEWFPSLAAASGAAGAAVRMAVVSFLFCALYIGGVVLLHGSREPLTQVARLLRDIIPWRSLPTSPRTVAWSQSAVATPTRGAD